MKIQLFLFLVYLGVASAKCPNDCNGNGTCNAYSACECYRNFMGADCSERSCHFSHAFIDTPQGDLNADGRTDTVYGASYQVVLGSDKSFFGVKQNSGDADQMVSRLAGLNDVPTGGASISLHRSTVDEEGDGYDHTRDTRFNLLVQESVSQEYELDVKDEFGLASMCHEKNSILTYAITFQVTKGKFDHTPPTEADLFSLGKNQRIIETDAPFQCNPGDPVYRLPYQHEKTATSMFEEMCAHMKPIGYFIKSHLDTLNIIEWIGNEQNAKSNDVFKARDHFNDASDSNTGADAFYCGCEFSPPSDRADPVVGVRYGYAFPADFTPTSLVSDALEDAYYLPGASVIHYPESFTGENALKVVNNENDNHNIRVCSITPTEYNVQWSGAKQWEMHPSNHAKAADTRVSSWDEGHFYRECSNKGICNRQTGLCECFAGYEGEGCIRAACANDCSGHGVCKRAADLNPDYNAWDALKTQSCVCDVGYSGPDCSLRLCPKGDDPVTRLQNKNAVQSFGYYYKEDGASNITDNFTFYAGIVDPSSPAENSEVKQLWFSLIFTTEDGEKLTTEAIDFKGPNLASTVEKALESLPGGIIQDVEVSEHKFDPSTGAAGQGADGHIVSVTFLSNSGDIPDLGARYNFYYSSSGAPGNSPEMLNTRNKPDGSFASRGFRLMKDSGNSPAAWYEAYPAGSFVRGTKENVVCSNRGICDNTTGLCSCFAGFTQHDCSLQNALAAA